MAKYRVGEGSFYYRKSLYRPGTEVEMPDDAKPPKHLTPVDDAAKAAYAKAHDVQVAQKPPEKPAQKKSEPVPTKFALGQ